MTFALRKRGVDPSQIEHIRVETYKISVDLTKDLKVATEDEAKFSLPFCIAVALLKGSVSLCWFNEATRTDPEVLALARRVEVMENPDATARFPSRQAEVIITMKDGTEMREKTLESCDKADNTQIIAKFEDAVPFIDADKRRRIIEIVTNIDAQENMTELMSLLH